MTPSDDLIFADEDSGTDGGQQEAAPWKVMIVDDEPAIHEVTKIALKGVKFSDRPLEFIDCYSGAEACETIQNHQDVALMLLDVVMETDHAGLDVAKFVRASVGNQNVRIVLRTGQPGQAPEREVITAYDINDYKEKTELTSSKLFTVIYSSLRAYRDITTIEASKHGLAHVIDASASIFQLSALDRFSQGVLEQLTALVQADPGALYLKSSPSLDALAVTYRRNEWHVVAGTGAYADYSGRDTSASLLSNGQLLDDVLKERRSLNRGRSYAAYFEDRLGNVSVLLLTGVDSITPIESDLIQMFMRNVSIAFENINLHSDLEETQRDIVCLLGESVERRSRETGNHVRRVAAISEKLALAYGLSEEEAQMLKYASPLHDLGKIAIPDAILNKPGIHTPEESAIMRQHAEIGHAMLVSSKRKVLQAAAIVAHEHHERWDGTGYPQGKAGKDIHIFGRITAVADVFDALLNDRCYKKAWPLEQVLDLFRKERGKQFDPDLVDLMFERLDELEQIRVAYRDEFNH
jgi:response regulator RpfG family c-di-GMP phosphodiesterase